MRARPTEVPKAKPGLKGKAPVTADTTQPKLRAIDFNDLVVMSAQEIMDLPDPDAGKIVIDKKLRTCTLHFGGYPYEIDLDQIRTEADLLSRVHHLSGKVWMTATRFRRLIDTITQHKRFKLYGGEGP